ncbi:MAG: valine--pyruvate transaminase [Pseudomonadota bacterium]
MHLSSFGEKFASPSGISELMEDLSTALADDPSILFMGGGNPGRVLAAEELFRDQLQALLDDPDRRHELLGVYQSPNGDRALREEVAAYLRKSVGWEVAADNIALSNGSQSAFFVLFNLLAGPCPGGVSRNVRLPFSPEYVGYRDVGVADGLFRAGRPQIALIDDETFRYQVDFSALKLGPDTGAVCVSRPSNPTGGMLTDRELQELADRCGGQQVPLILDGAYGLPFPGLVYGGAEAFWNDNTILTLSLSKLGLPGLRTGIVIAREDITVAFNRANTVLNLATGTPGPQLLRGSLLSGLLDQLCTAEIKPYYEMRRALALECFRKNRGDLPVRLHQSEGGFFLWLWCESLPIDSQELYERLKRRGVIVLPGNGFFMGLDEPWDHERQCLRISFAGDTATISRGIEMIFEELRSVYR